MDTQDSKPPILLVRPFEKKDMGDFKNMLLLRRLSLSLCENMPRIGYVCRDEVSSVAIGFLRHIEGDFGLLDGLITDPAFSSEKRSLAIDFVVKCILNRSQELGMKKLLAYSTDENILRRAES